MRSTIVVKADPVSNDAHCVLLAFEAMPMNALILQRPDNALDHSILLRAMRCDELLFQPIAPNETRIIPAGKDQAIV